MITSSPLAERQKRQKRCHLCQWVCETPKLHSHQTSAWTHTVIVLVITEQPWCWVYSFCVFPGPLYFPICIMGTKTAQTWLCVRVCPVWNGGFLLRRQLTQTKCNCMLALFWGQISGFECQVIAFMWRPQELTGSVRCGHREDTAAS